MKKLKKYTCGQGDGMFESKKGFWVELSDHKQVVAELKKQIKKLKKK